jgi:dipeptidyl aminopeptidase/acylaminoacyl peptidase
LGLRFFWSVFCSSTADASVPIDWSRSLAGYFKEHGKKIEFHVYPGEKHEFIDRWPEVMRRTAAFFDVYLRR